MPKRLSPKERVDRWLEARRKLDAQLLRLINRHGLQGVFGSLRRVAEEASKTPSLCGNERLKWEMAERIITTADDGLYGQHCDLPYNRTR